MLGKLGRFLHLAGQLAPLVLASTKLAPIAAQVAAGIQEAEALASGGSLSDKLGHAVNIAVDAAQAANAQAGHEVLDPNAVRATAGAIISGVVQTVNAANQVVVSADADPA